MQKATESTVVDEYVPKNSFSSFDILPELKLNILARGYAVPTPIQDQAIPFLLEGRDVVGIADTGTGKTAAFLIPLINKILKDRSQKVLIIAPTRELATQIEDELKIFAGNLRIYSALCIGGVNIGRQIHSLYRNPNVVVGTPGRLQDLERQRKIYFGEFKTIVLDEVDRMLDMGFVNEMKYIISKLATPRHSLFFSATTNEKVRNVMKDFLVNPVTISIHSAQVANNIDQDVIRLQGRPKVEVLQDLLKEESFQKVLVFGRTKWGVEKLSVALTQKGFRVASIHGNKNQNQRSRAIEQFKRNRIQALLATDVASRGLDINDVTHVINFDQPESYEDYIHRIGRTGRANKKGKALTFID
ncbi:DEAD/DEAH box helicase [Candidatus Woesebacteria bacterium]|nr:DEAD/DEAH box helicase [Candidatus Woesebacteria bacterium]